MLAKNRLTTNEEIFNQAKKAGLKPKIKDGKIIVEGNFIITFAFVALYGLGMEKKTIVKKTTLSEIESLVITLNNNNEYLRVGSINQIA